MCLAVRPRVGGVSLYRSDVPRVGRHPPDGKALAVKRTGRSLFRSGQVGLQPQCGG